MGVLGFLVLGLVAGALARMIHSGPEPGGVLGTLAVGVVGALIGGVVASALGLGGLGGFFSVGTWLVAIAGSLVLLWAYEMVGRHGGVRHMAHHH